MDPKNSQDQNIDQDPIRAPFHWLTLLPMMDTDWANSVPFFVYDVYDKSRPRFIKIKQVGRP